MSQVKANIIIAGGSGLVGSSFVKLFSQKYSIYILTRSQKKDSEFCRYISWDVEKEWIEEEKIPDTYAIINLCGSGIADKRWTQQRKSDLLSSRIDPTTFLYKIFKDRMPEVYIGASAIGYYGDRGDEILTADSAPSNDGFLSECCIAWEEASALFEDAVNHHYILRIGIVLSNQGGALPKMVLPVKLGGAGYFGSGTSYYSWIHIDDLSHSLDFLLNTKPQSRAYNGVAPSPVRLKNFMKALKSTFASYALLLPVPTLLLKVTMGEMSTMLTNSDRIYPKHLEQAGFRFTYNTLEQALLHLKENPTV